MFPPPVVPSELVYESHPSLKEFLRRQVDMQIADLRLLSHLPEELIELIRRSLRGERFLSAAEAFEVERSLPHGQVAAVLVMARAFELARLLERAPSRQRSLALAMVVLRWGTQDAERTDDAAFQTLDGGETLRNQFGTKTA